MGAPNQRRCLRFIRKIKNAWKWVKTWLWVIGWLRQEKAPWEALEKGGDAMWGPAPRGQRWFSPEASVIVPLEEAGRRRRWVASLWSLALFWYHRPTYLFCQDRRLYHSEWNCYSNVQRPGHWLTGFPLVVHDGIPGRTGISAKYQHLKIIQHGQTRLHRASAVVFKHFGHFLHHSNCIYPR
jgi:hypothetical protein